MKITKLERISYIYIETNQDQTFRKEVGGKEWHILRDDFQRWDYYGESEELDNLVLEHNRE